MVLLAKQGKARAKKSVQSSELSARGKETECAPPVSEADPGGTLAFSSRMNLLEFCALLCGEWAGEVHGNA